jgi:ankyrin repeat protein
MGNCDEVEELLDAGLSAMAPGPQGLHPVHYAAFSGHLEIVRLLNRHGADMWAVAGPNGETPLLAAAAAGNLDVVEFLMGEEGADVDCASRAHGATPLLCACDHGHLDVARFLAMDKKADLFMPDKEGCTPLMKAVEAGHREVVEMLLEGVNVEELQAGSRRDGEDYMRAAMIRRELAAASVFLEKGVDGSFTPGKEKTPVQKAIGGGMSGVVEYLLSEALKVTNLSLEDMDSDSE